MKLKGKSAKKFEEDLTNRNNPENIKTFEKAKEVYEGIKQVGDVKIGKEIRAEIKLIVETAMYNPVGIYDYGSAIDKIFDKNVVLPEDKWLQIQTDLEMFEWSRKIWEVRDEKWLQTEKDLQLLSDISYHATIENQKLHGKLDRIEILIWNNPDLLNYEKGVKWLEELRNVIEDE
jgi:hypothetical protein